MFTEFQEIDDLAGCDPDALALLLILRRNHFGRDSFVIANGMAGSLGWRLPRFREARSRLESYGAVECSIVAVEESAIRRYFGSLLGVRKRTSIITYTLLPLPARGGRSCEGPVLT